MSDIIDSTDSIIADFIQDMDKDKNIKSVIENSIFVSVDDSAKNKGTYTVTGCMPEVWGAIFHSHFRTMEEQLEQIIENTKISWLDYVILGLTAVGMSDTLKGGMNKGIDWIVKWIQDNINKIPIIGGIIGGVATNTTDVQADAPEETTETEPVQSPVIEPGEISGTDQGEVPIPELANASVGVGEVTGFSIMEKVKGVGSWLKDTGFSFIEDYSSRLNEHRSREGENFSDGVGEGSSGNFFSSLYGEIKATGSLFLDLGNELLNNENPFGLESVKLIGEIVVAAGALWAIINTILGVIGLIVVAVYTGIAEIVGAIAAVGSTLIVAISKILSFIEGIIAIISGKVAATNSMEGFTPAMASLNNTIPGTNNDDSKYLTEYITTMEKNVYMNTLATNDTKSYGDLVAEKNNYISNNDTARSDYAELLASNSKRNVNYNPIINNYFDMQVTNEVDAENLIRRVKREISIEVLGIQATNIGETTFV